MTTIGIIALSGACDREKLNNAKLNLEGLGFNVKLSKNIFDKERYLAGSDECKLEELYKFFEDPEIDIIMCARGGYGAIRLVNKIDYEVLKKNPKIFTGFSDVTALLLMIYKKTGMVTYHGAMACSDFGSECCTPPQPSPSREGAMFTWRSFCEAINGNRLEFCGDKTYNEGRAEGIIWGGNLATVVSLCGLDFIPDEDFIFFAEDLNEPVYKIDRMFQQLLNIEKFRIRCKGIVLGDFLDVDKPEWLEEYFGELAEELDVPVAGGFKITHAQEKITIPVGKNAKLLNNTLVVAPSP